MKTNKELQTHGHRGREVGERHTVKAWRERRVVLNEQLLLLLLLLGRLHESEVLQQSVLIISHLMSHYVFSTKKHKERATKQTQYKIKKQYLMIPVIFCKYHLIVYVSMVSLFVDDHMMFYWCFTQCYYLSWLSCNHQSPVSFLRTFILFHFYTGKRKKVQIQLVMHVIKKLSSSYETVNAPRRCRL